MRETLEEFISNLTQFKDLLIKGDYNAILKKWKANKKRNFEWYEYKGVYSTEVEN
jgi:hypothetical protein